MSMSSGSHERGGNTAACLLSAKARREGYMDGVVEGGLLLFFCFFFFFFFIARGCRSFFFPSSRSPAKQCKYVSCYREKAGRDVSDFYDIKVKKTLPCIH
jgi:hypothetical protein